MGWPDWAKTREEGEKGCREGREVW